MKMTAKACGELGLCKSDAHLTLTMDLENLRQTLKHKQHEPQQLGLV